MTLKVGDTIYRLDYNRRRYQRDANGRAHGAPIYSEHFDPRVIEGETPRSWLVEGGRTKVAKATVRESAARTGFGYQWFTADGMAAAIWRHENFHHLMRHAERNATFEQLQQIATLVGYRPEATE
jgi:hypothetical protein